MREHSERLIEHDTERLLRDAGYGRTGFAEGYDAHRPAPPAVLPDILCLEAQVEKPRLVVDLGSGTGLSTRAWTDRADEVVGVEASAEMRAQAEAATEAANVRFVHAYAHETGLPDGAADIVTCSQSFHWMDPESTLAEAARILRPGGVFAAYDYDWPPVVQWEVEAAYSEMFRRLGLARAAKGQTRFPKDGHLERIRESGHFRYAREVVFHSRDRGSAARIVGMALSLGHLRVMLQEGASEEELGFAALREIAERALGPGEHELFLCYRVRLGVK